jgi:hypothetical protein
MSYHRCWSCRFAIGSTTLRCLPTREPWRRDQGRMAEEEVGRASPAGSRGEAPSASWIGLDEKLAARKFARTGSLVARLD